MAPRYESLQGLKPRFFWRVFGATEAMSCYKAASFVFCAASLYGQTAPTVQAPVEPLQQGQVIKTDVNEVSLDLLVHDKRHNAVMDLKPDELQVTDDGVPVKLSEFHLVKG